MRYSFQLYVGLLLTPLSQSFQVSNQITSRRNGFHSVKSRFERSYNTRLYDLSEWRDMMFDAPAGLVEDKESGPFREICILPFPLDDALLQGETKELCLYEERFHKLFEKAMNEHGGVVAMGLLAPPSGILQSMPLCEIESFQKMEGKTGFGTNYSILATIRSVGRGNLMSIDEEDENKEFLTGWCTEMSDDESQSDGKTASGRDIMKLGNELADKLEHVFSSIIILETRLEQQEEYVEIDEDVSEATLRRMLLEAELEDDEDDELDDDEDDDEDDEDEDASSSGNGMRARFEHALKQARASDFQGYRIAMSQSDKDNNLRSVQELSALSWAYFSPELFEDNLSFRLRAIEVTDLIDRLKLALVMCMKHRSKLKEVLKSRDSNDDP